ncbi:SIMPL domain-containing protein [Sphingomonas sp. AOB5]|uniref:SIMPL domain-containing protein n=1 Tax=Sphingomonas sp. AOB5 TaxID=3034017 RepID=UPI0023F83A6D|nr:SIMPL domain-containing protein [Sphingomonas sp. AOB5]MDF7776177.1 SIMPL domain-containing protein [Sphingomonas sp. AOB5]
MRAMIQGLAVLAVFAAVPAAAQDMPPRPPMMQDGTLLEITAEGHSTRVPDVAIIEAGVTTQAPTAADALAQNNAQMNKVIAALKASGVADRDIQTSTISLQPQYRNVADGQPQVIFAYMASNSVSVRFRDVSKAGSILDLLVKQGANTISGPNLTLSKPEEALNEARVDAVAQARARAELYAKAAGLRVDRILSISDGSPSRVYPMAERFAMADKSVPVQAGEQQISATVTMRFLLK